jgi:hypothetical protein
VIDMRDDGNVADLIHSGPMFVGQPASVEGNRRVVAAKRSPYNLARAEYAAALPGVKRVPKELEARPYANGGPKSKSALTYRTA